VTFLLRAVYSTMNAVAHVLQDDEVSCPSNNPCDASCYNVYTLMQLWLAFTPEFQLSVELISSPLTLLVALWGMTSEHTLRLMQSRRREMNVMQVGVLQETLPPPLLLYFDFDLFLFVICHLCSVCTALLPSMNEFETCVRPKRVRARALHFLNHSPVGNGCHTGVR
jgi:hypothetical protein